MRLIKKVFIGVVIAGGILAIGRGTDVEAASSSTSWAFKNNEFKNLGNITSTKTVNGLTLIATSAKPMTVTSANAKLGNETYSSMLSLGGSGTTSYRCVRVLVEKNAVLKVTLNSSSKRSLFVTDKNGEKLISFASGTALVTRSYTYTGSDSSVYLYSNNSNINLYKIQVDYSSSSSTNTGNTGSSTGGSNSGSSTGGNTSSGSTSVPSGSIEVKNGGTSLSQAMSKASAGQTIVINGTVKSGRVEVKNGVNIKGINNGTIDFSQTSGDNGKGLVFSYDGSTVENLTVKNAADNGIFISGNNNIFKYVIDF